MTRDSTKRCILDCETNETARVSVASILGISRDELLSHLRRFTFKNTDQVEALFDSIEEEYGCSWGFSHTAWFHLTRCPLGSDFNKGLLPLSMMIDHIWDSLFQCCKLPITKSDWNRFRINIKNSSSWHHANVYRVRTTRDTQNGPDAVLIGDINYNRIVGQAHFLDEGPEFVILICTEFRKQFNYDLLRDFKITSRPCIVKFVTADSDLDYLLRALYYLHELEQSDPCFSIEHSTCYIGKGTSISPHNIKKVIFLDNS